MPRRVPILSCGIFAAEFARLKPELRERLEPRFLDSMLHMRPEALDAVLGGALAEPKGGSAGRTGGEAEPRILLYGDCCPHMREYGAAPGVLRIPGSNCVEIALGRERYRELRRRRAFFFMPEWVERWEEVFEHELGLADPELAKAFMRDEMSLLVYVDTGVRPVPREILAEIEARFELPLAIESPGLGPLERALEEALREVDARDEPIPEGPAFDFLVSDLVERLLSLADRPSESVEYIARELRSLVGVRSVFVFECPGLTGEGRHRLVSVLPERRRPLGEDPRMEELAELTHEHEDAAFFGPGSPGRLGALASELGLGDSLLVPLRYARSRVGVILLLGLLDEANLGTILDSFGRLSSVIALVLRNAFLYERLEEAVAERTRELEAQKAALAGALAEKEVMLKEIHHRVKNNLQVVNSLLYLRTLGIEDPSTLALFEESRARVEAMALVHEELYRSPDLARVEMADYLVRLAESILGGRAGLLVSVEAESCLLLPDQALPCGLVLNELLLNSLKYAAAQRESCRVQVGFRKVGEELALEVRDDGPGFPAGRDPRSGGGMGYSIVTSLVNQLRGRLELLEGPGAAVRLTFPRDRT